MKKNNDQNLEKKKNIEEISSGEKSKEEKEIIVSSSEWEEIRKKAFLVDEYYNKLLRLGAEFENARRRMHKEKEEIIRFANHQLILEILPVIDDFERLIEGLENRQVDENIREGIKMIQKRFSDILEKNGLTRMKVVGEKFDPTKHEALMTIETDEHSEDTIVEEIRSGYLFYDKILRPAVVKVAKKKEKTNNQ